MSGARLDQDDLLVELVKALKQELGIDLTHPKTGLIKHEEIVKLAETFCSLSFKPAQFYRTAKDIVEAKADKEILPLTLDEYQQAITAESQGDGEQEADSAQERIGEILAKAYEHGDRKLKITRDLWKARKYGRVDKLSKEDKPEYLKAPRALQNSQWSMANLYLYFGWLTAFRLFFVRMNRILDYFNNGFLVNRTVDIGNSSGNSLLNPITKHLKEIAFAVSLSNIIELVFDVSVLFRTAFFPTLDEKQHNPSILSRVINTFSKGERPMRMLNATIWFSVNLACYFIAPPLAAILNLTFVAFDLVPDIYRYFRDKWKYNNLLIAIKTKIKDDLKEIETTEVDSPKGEALRKNVNKLKQVQDGLEKEKERAMHVRKKALFVTLLILIGMAILLVPQIVAAACLSILAVKITAAAVAMLGSIIGGLGNKLWQKTKEKMNILTVEIAEKEYDQLLNEQKFQSAPRTRPLQISPQHPLITHEPKHVFCTTRAALIRRFETLNPQLAVVKHSSRIKPRLEALNPQLAVEQASNVEPQLVHQFVSAPAADKLSPVKSLQFPHFSEVTPGTDRPANTGRRYSVVG